LYIIFVILYTVLSILFFYSVSEQLVAMSKIPATHSAHDHRACGQPSGREFLHPVRFAPQVGAPLAAGTAEEVQVITDDRQCCTHDCNEGRDCPLRPTPTRTLSDALMDGFRAIVKHLKFRGDQAKTGRER